MSDKQELKHRSFERFAYPNRFASLRWSMRTLVVFFIAFMATMGYCCSVPVFRYALEHWSPEPFVVHVVSHSGLSNDQNELLKSLNEGASIANVKVQVHTAAQDTKLDSAIASLIPNDAAEQSAWLVVEDLRRGGGGPSLVWQAPFSKTSVSQMLNSPAREKIAEGLVDGDSVAWVFLDSGDTDKDEKKYAKLQLELQRLERVIELPVLDQSDLKDTEKAANALKLRFRLHRIAHKDVNESAFVSMLLSTESDLLEEYRNGTPMAFPIFGRGRVLYALLGEGIATGTIEEACRFLAGACQCTVKQENPGADLLFSFDWNSRIHITSLSKEVTVGNVTGPPIQVPIPAGTVKKSEAVTATATVQSADTKREPIETSAIDGSSSKSKIALISLIGVAAAVFVWVLSKNRLVRKKSS